MTPLPPPVSDDWMPMLDVYWKLILVLGDPEEALRDIRRELVSGRVRAMRRRSLADGVSDTELTPTFWRDVKLFPYRDDRGRDIIQLRQANIRYDSNADREPANVPSPPGITEAVVRRVGRISGYPKPVDVDLSGVYYLHRGDCIKRWAFLAPVDVGDTSAAAAAKAKTSTKIAEKIREAMRKVNDQAVKNGRKPPNIAELADLVHPYVPETSKRNIKELANEDEFKNQRLRRGKRWHGK
jgi:hypothetical protein